MKRCNVAVVIVSLNLFMGILATVAPTDMLCAAGYVGPPWPTNIVKIVDVPEMDYYAKNQQGEVSDSCTLR